MSAEDHAHGLLDTNISFAGLAKLITLVEVTRPAAAG
jgi:hypothetical protein